MRTIVYVSCATDKVIVGFEMDRETGALRELARTAVPGTAEPSTSSLPLAVSPDRCFLYAALRTPPFPVVTFAIDPSTAALQVAGSAKLPDSMCYLSTDPSGSLLFSASYGGAVLGVSPITSGIAGDTAQVVATPPKAHCVRPDPAGRFAYAACLGGDVILAQPIEGNSLAATQNPAARTRDGAGPRHLVFARGGQRLYCVNELDATVNAYDRDMTTGALREVQSVPTLSHDVSGNAAAADIHLSPDERFLYASVRSSNTLACYRVDAETGRLSPIGSVASEPNPRGFAIEQQGRFLLCAGMDTGQVATYAIDQATGALARIGATAAGPGANWVEVLEFA
ncbi:MAG: lactonase family protein [Acetobacteraceae bacterium]|nr:lactonase family protein [Acetobacteraceae bacterium]